MSDSFLRSRVSTPHIDLYMSKEIEPLRERGVLRGLHLSMLRDDFDNHQYGYDTSLEFEGVEYRTGEGILQSLLRDFSEYQEREDGDKLIWLLIASIVEHYLTSGFCCLELFGEEQNKVSVARLGVVPAWSIRRRRGSIYQVAPKEGRIAWRSLKDAELLMVDLPGGLGAELLKIRTQLEILGSGPVGDTDLIRSSGATGYSFSLHNELVYETAAKITKTIGWSGRELFLKKATNSYRMYRSLKFLRVWLVLVDVTLKFLNELLRRPQVTNVSSVTVRVRGLPTIAEVDQGMQSVLDGSEPLDEISHRLLYPKFSRRARKTTR